MRIGIIAIGYAICIALAFSFQERENKALLLGREHDAYQIWSSSLAKSR